MATSRKYEDHDKLTKAISRVLAPVVICMILSVWLVNSTGSGCPSKSSLAPSTPLPRFRPTETKKKLPPKGTPLPFGRKAAIIFVCVFCVLIVSFTYLLVFLVKQGCTKFIAIWLFTAVFLIFAYVGGVYLFEFARSRCISVDWISLTFVTWNFTVTGIVSVFGNVPRLINQAYLIVMSALMAYIFRALPSWTTWTLLAVLVVWDLFAVLTPFGPLRKLVEHARERNEPLPALVYDTNPDDVGRDPEATPAVMFGKGNRENRRGNRDDGNQDDGDEAASARRKKMRLRIRKREEAEMENANNNETEQEVNRENGVTVQAEAETAVPVDLRGSEQNEKRKPDEIAENRTEEVKTKEAVGTLGTHLKLGLGDFVFYSILVAEASKSGAMTTVMSFVAILAGLCMTLFLVLVYRKALPALPISIIFGIVFHFLTVFTVEPLVQNMFVDLSYH